MAIAIGRSRLEPVLMRFAGARLTVVLRAGKVRSEFWIALLTRSLDSAMVLSPIPTRLKAGRPLVRLASTSMILPS